MHKMAASEQRHGAQAQIQLDCCQGRQGDCQGRERGRARPHVPVCLEKRGRVRHQLLRPYLVHNRAQ